MVGMLRSIYNGFDVKDITNATLSNYHCSNSCIYCCSKFYRDDNGRDEVLDVDDEHDSSCVDNNTLSHEEKL